MNTERNFNKLKLMKDTLCNQNPIKLKTDKNNATKLKQDGPTICKTEIDEELMETLSKDNFKTELFVNYHFSPKKMPSSQTQEELKESAISNKNMLDDTE